jgi:UDP-glucuronate 4-epimerase
MNVLVTGGAGFIGSHVCEALLRAGHSVAIVDNLDDFYSPAWKLENLDCVARAGQARFYHDDICAAERMAEVFARECPEAVIHLAARAGVRPSIEAPLLYEHVNVRGTLVLLETARQCGVKKFLFASSSSVYGLTDEAPFREDSHQSLPLSPYAATKLAGEKLCYTYSHLYGLRVICLRLFTVYGPRQRPDLAIYKFTDLIERGAPIPVYGDGSTKRDYTHIDDILQGILAALAADAQYEVLNLGNSHPVTLLELVREIETRLGKKAQIEWLPEQAGDMPVTFADISKARRLLDYRPRVPLAEGLSCFIAWHRERRAG